MSSVAPSNTVSTIISMIEDGRCDEHLKTIARACYERNKSLGSKGAASNKTGAAPRDGGDSDGCGVDGCTASFVSLIDWKGGVPRYGPQQVRYCRQQFIGLTATTPDQRTVKVVGVGNRAFKVRHEGDIEFVAHSQLVDLFRGARRCTSNN